uniref:BESS domain-containing protein n=1 Tax=Clastoptera arizonana TaxID=38151 RepID=A0A1B6CP02_9HEMI
MSKKNRTEIIKEVIATMNDVAKVKNEEDEFDQFGSFIATQLKQLPAISALESQEKILSILTKERISIIKGATKHHSYGIQQHGQENETIIEDHLEEEEEFDTIEVPVDGTYLTSEPTEETEIL